MTTDVTLETPCLADTCWQRTAVDSGRVEDFDLCRQCFPNGWDDVTEEIDTFLYSYRNGSKLHRSVDYDGETDFSMFGPNSGDNGLAAKLEDPEFEPDYEFEWDRENRGEPLTDGGQDVDGTEQVALSRNPVEREVAQLDRDSRKPMCPDCGSYVGHTKSGGKPLPETDAKAFGWSCGDCNLTFPSNCHGPHAPGFSDSMAGLEVEFRDGERRWVPVPARYVETAADQEGEQ